MADIYAFGDSITYGSWDPKKSGWVSQLRLYLDQKAQKDEKYFSIIYNLGIPGETTEGLVNRFDNEIQARKSLNNRSIVILAYGVNDSGYISSSNKPMVSIDRFRNNIESVVNKCKDFKYDIIIVTATPVKEREQPRDIIEYNDVLTEISKKYGTKFVDVHSAFTQSNDNLLDQDCIHPNTQGHEVIFSLMKKLLDELI